MRVVKIFLVLLILGIAFVGFVLARKVADELGRAGVSPVYERDLTTSKPESSLKEIVEKAFEGSRGEYFVAIKNLKSGESFFQNENEATDSASLYKLWLMAATFEKIKKGETLENEVLKGDVASLNEKFGIDSELSELKNGETIEMTVSEAGLQMITISHNYAALLLSDKIGLSSVENFLEREKLVNSTISAPPRTSAMDTLQFFEKLYRGEIIDREYSEKMLNLFSMQKSNDGIPKYLSKDIRVAHKTGDLFDFKHDAGIVFSPKADYIFVILSKSDYPPGALERIALVSKAVYDYFNF